MNNTILITLVFILSILLSSITYSSEEITNEMKLEACAKYTQQLVANLKDMETQQKTYPIWFIQYMFMWEKQIKKEVGIKWDMVKSVISSMRDEQMVIGNNYKIDGNSLYKRYYSECSHIALNLK
tara:strand:- start:175 stop:549 length:375 start_codon:yes stop_codon:yes gene_type:complete